MTVSRWNQNMMSHGASAKYAEASFCAHDTHHTTVSLILDAVLASIIICALITLVSALALGGSLLVLVGFVLLVDGKVNTPKTRKHA